MKVIPAAHTLFALGVFVFVGCASKPATQPETETPPETKGKKAWEATERFSFDTGIRGLLGTPAGATGLAVSSDGKFVLAMATGKVGNVQVWDLSKRSKLHQYDRPNGYALPVAISPDNRVGAYPAGDGESSIVLLDLASGQELRRLQKKGEARLKNTLTYGLSFSSSGDLLVIANGDEIIGWNPVTGAERFVWNESGHISALSNLFDGGKKVAAGGSKGRVKVWNLDTGKVDQTLFEGGKEPVELLCVSPDGKRLAAYEQFGPIRVWNLTTGELAKELKGRPGMWSAMRFLPDSRTLVYNSSSALVLLDTETGKEEEFGESRVRQYPVAVTPDGLTLVSGSEDAKIRVWDLKLAR